MSAHPCQRPRCGDPVDGDLWLSESLADRRYAASLCAGWAVLVERDQAAEEAPA
jgi:hypothetical protein